MLFVRPLRTRRRQIQEPSLAVCSYLFCYIDGPLDVLTLRCFVHELVVNPPVPFANSIQRKHFSGSISAAAAAAHVVLIAVVAMALEEASKGKPARVLMVGWLWLWRIKCQHAGLNKHR